MLYFLYGSGVSFVIKFQTDRMYGFRLQFLGFGQLD